MSTVTEIERVKILVEEILVDFSEIFLVKIKIKPTNNIKVYLDADDGLNIDRCAKINRKMARFIEENNWYTEGNFSLEISSHGVDEPLVLPRQFKKNLNRNIELTYLNEAKEEQIVVGKLEEYNEALAQLKLSVENKKNKKQPIEKLIIAFDSITKAVVQINFK
jgi:ribosome maturation factor RimP